MTQPYQTSNPLSARPAHRPGRLLTPAIIRHLSDADPIENALAKRKALLRKAAERTVDGFGTPAAQSFKLSPQPNAQTTSLPLDTMQREPILF
jgi:hypothetical protein